MTHLFCYFPLKKQLEKHEQAQEEYALIIAELQAKKDAHIAELEAKLASQPKPADQSKPKAKVQGVEPVDFSGTDGASSGGGDFLALARDIRDEANPGLSAVKKKMGIGMNAAMSRAASDHPEAYKKWRASKGIAPIRPAAS